MPNESLHKENLGGEVMCESQGVQFAKRNTLFLGSP